MNEQDLKSKIQEIIFQYENWLLKAGMTGNNIDYDILEKERIKVWDYLYNLIK